MSNNSNPHDQFFKAVFSKKKIMADFIKHFLPKSISQNINLDSLNLENNSFIDEEMKEHFSDLIYSCQYKKEREVKIALLFEHKSYLVKHPHFQLNRYMLNSWKQDKEQKQKLTRIVPIILYHGKQKWKKQKLADYFEAIDNELNYFLPGFDYILIDLNNYSDEQILALKIVFLVNSLIALKHSHDKEYLLKNSELFFFEINRHINSQQGLEFFELIFIYLTKSHEIKPSELIKLNVMNDKSLKPKFISTYDQLIQQGEIKGMEKGMEKGITKVLNKIISDRPTWTDEQIADLTGESIELVQKVRILQNKKKENS